MSNNAVGTIDSSASDKLIEVTPSAELNKPDSEQQIFKKC